MLFLPDISYGLANLPVGASNKVALVGSLDIANIFSRMFTLAEDETLLCRASLPLAIAGAIRLNSDCCAPYSVGIVSPERANTFEDPRAAGSVAIPLSN